MRALFLPLSILMPFALASASDAGTLKTVRDKGAIACGVSNHVKGFASVDENGEWNGFDIDFCRAIAAAVFGDASRKRIQIVPLAPHERFDALKSKRVDALTSNATWTLSRESDNQVAFTGVTYFDQQGFMAPKHRKLVSLRQLDGLTVCIESGTTNESNFVEYAKENGIRFTPLKAAQFSELVKDYDAGKCDVITSDHSQLYAQKLTLSRPEDHEIIKPVISQEPIGPAVRLDDLQWFEVVKWVGFAMLNAEALELSQANIETAKDAQNQDVRRFVGIEGELGKKLGLAPQWAYNIVKLVGNYGEALERNLGEGSELGIKRSLNKLVKKGGIQYAPPMR